MVQNYTCHCHLLIFLPSQHCIFQVHLHINCESFLLSIQCSGWYSRSPLRYTEVVSRWLFPGHTGIKCPFYCPVAQAHTPSGGDTVQNSELHHGHPWSQVGSSCLPGPTLLCSPYILEPQKFRATGLHSMVKRGMRDQGLSSGSECWQMPRHFWPGLNGSKTCLGLSDCPTVSKWSADDKACGGHQCCSVLPTWSAWTKTTSPPLLSIP